MKILGDDALLELILISKITSDKKNVRWYDEWLTFNFKIKLNGFIANFDIDLTGSDIIEFIKSASHTYELSFNKNSPDIKFETLEESIYMKGIINYKGNIEWEGFVIYPVGDGNKLDFKFNTDLHQLLNIKNQLMQECGFMFNKNI